MKRMNLWLMVAAISVALAPMAPAIPVVSGDIAVLDPSATEYGAVRFKDFINTADGLRGQNLYLQNNSSSLGNATGSDGRARVNGDPLWTVGGVANAFWFEYRPVAGATDLILSGATDRSSPGFSRVIDDPLLLVNYISFYLQSNEGTTPTTDSITLNLTDLDSNPLLPGALTWGYPPGGVAKWYLSDPSLLANGFILQGNIVLSGTIERGESDKVQIAFGHSPVLNRVPDGGSMLAMLGTALAGLAGLRRKLGA